MEIVALLIITVLLPIAWLFADYRRSAKLRRILGIAAILWSFAIASFVGALQKFGANSYFTFASKELLDASVQQLRAGKTEAVIREWSRASERFSPTYENRGKYQQIVDDAVEGMKKP